VLAVTPSASGIAVAECMTKTTPPVPTQSLQTTLVVRLAAERIVLVGDSLRALGAHVSSTSQRVPLSSSAMIGANRVVLASVDCLDRMAHH